MLLKTLALEHLIGSMEIAAGNSYSNNLSDHYRNAGTKICIIIIPVYYCLSQKMGMERRLEKCGLGYFVEASTRSELGLATRMRKDQ